MWRSMSIAKKIFLALSLLVFGYSITIAYGFLTGARNTKKLSVLTSMDFPACQNSMEALRIFEEEVKLYEYMVTTGDTFILPEVKEKQEALEKTLTELTGFIREPRIKKDIERLRDQLQAFNLIAPSVYLEMRKNVTDYNLEIVNQASLLANQWKEIHSDLKKIKDHYTNSINTDLANMSNHIRWQWLINGWLFVVGVGASLIIIIIIVMRFIRSPLQKTIDAFDTGAMGDFSMRLDDTAGDEFGQLARYFNTFMEKLHIYNSDLHEEINNHRISAENLRKSEELYTRLVNTIPEIVVRTDLDGKILFVNEFTEKLSGYKRNEVIGQNLIKFVSPDYYERARQNLLDFSGDPSSNEYIVFKKDKSSLYVEVRGDILRNKDGKPFGRVYVSRDITEKKQAEKDREKLQEQLYQSQKMDAIGILAGGVAHDFNNMLAGIMGYTELTIKEMPPSDPLQKNLYTILDIAKRSASLTRQLLSFARKETIEPIIFDLNEAIEAILKMIRRLIGENIELSWVPGEGRSTVFMDPSQFDQVMVNLCVNAKDAISTTGKIIIGTDTASFDEAYCASHANFIPGEYVLLAVSDDGCGMDKETLNHIFEPFFTTKEVGQGTGMGLPTVYGIVKQNQGFINVYSELGQGTTIKIYLPLKAVTAENADISTIEEIPGSQGETILIVEDEPSLLEMNLVMLQHLGYVTLSAGTPTEAIRIFQESSSKIHLVITDVVMPEMNGRELVDQLKRIQPGIKYLFMSGYTANIIAHQGVMDKGVNFIQKPFTLKTLATKIREVMN